FFRYFMAPVDIYFLSESKKHPDFDTINPGHRHWGEGVLHALNYIKTPYILWLQDDYFLIEPFGEAMLEMNLMHCREFGMDHLILDRISKHYTIGDGPHYCYFDTNFVKMSDDSDYLTSLQASIFERQFLLNNIYPHESPWDFEIKGTKRIRGQGYKIYIHPMEWYLEVVTRGKYNDNYEKARKILNL
ncbi:MAG: hypothetical protein V5A47_09470, partial [Bacteroidales bacterium]